MLISVGIQIESFVLNSIIRTCTNLHLEDGIILSIFMTLEDKDQLPVFMDRISVVMPLIIEMMDSQYSQVAIDKNLVSSCGILG